MSDIIAGYFANEKEHKHLSHLLQNAGFAHDNFILFIDENSDRYLAAVKVRDDEEKAKAEQVFSENGSSDVYFFKALPDNVTYPEIKSLIESRAKADITDTPDVDIKTGSDGISSEVKFGE